MHNSIKVQLSKNEQFTRYFILYVKISVKIKYKIDFLIRSITFLHK